MRLFSKNAEQYIQSLATALSQDPSSLENWRCVHITHTEEMPFAWFETTLKGIRESHQDADCDVVHCSDNDVLFVSHNLKADQLFEIAGELANAANEPAENNAHMAFYDLFHDWRTIRDVLLSKAGEPKQPASQPELHHFGDISSLQEVFAEARKLRKARMPLQVMLVEDDPLTRRLVATTFKEKYVLITAASAEEAIVNYLLHAPDIVFLDIGLPDASGMDVLHRIMECDPDAYVVMFSGNSYLDNITAALGTGASGFVAKPFKKEKMQHYIQDSALHHHKYAS